MSYLRHKFKDLEPMSYLRHKFEDLEPMGYLRCNLRIRSKDVIRISMDRRW